VDATVLLAAGFSGASAERRGFAEAREFQQRRWDTGANQLLTSVVGAVEAEVDVVAGRALVVTVAFDGDGRELREFVRLEVYVAGVRT
jgi:hypothetical protein